MLFCILRDMLPVFHRIESSGKVFLDVRLRSSQNVFPCELPGIFHMPIIVQWQLLEHPYLIFKQNSGKLTKKKYFTEYNKKIAVFSSELQHPITFFFNYIPPKSRWVVSIKFQWKMLGSVFCLRKGQSFTSWRSVKSLA